MAITEKIRGIVDFLTQGLEQNNDDDVFEDIMNEAGGEEYETEDNLALAPYHQSSYQQKNDKTDLKEALLTCTRLCSQGDLEATAYLGKFYSSGLVVKKNTKVAEQYYK